MYNYASTRIVLPVPAKSRASATVLAECSGSQAQFWIMLYWIVRVGLLRCNSLLFLVFFLLVNTLFPARVCLCVCCRSPEEVLCVPHSHNIHTHTLRHSRTHGLTCFLSESVRWHRVSARPTNVGRHMGCSFL